MKDSRRVLKTVFIKWFQGMLEILAFFPILYTIGILLIENEVFIWFVSLSGLYLMGVLLGGYLFEKPRYIRLLLGLLIALAVSMVTSHHMLTKILVFLSGNIGFHRGVGLQGSRWSHVFPPSALWVGLIIYFLSGVIYTFTIVLNPYFDVLAWTGFAYLIIVLFVSNTEQLKSATLPGEETVPVLSSSVLRNNRILILLSLVVVMVIGYFNKLKDGTAWLVRKAFMFMLEAFMFLAGLFITPIDGIEAPPSQGPMELIPEEIQEPSLLKHILNIAGLILSWIAVALLLWFALKAFYKLLKKLYRYIIGILRERMSLREDTGFIDEKIKLKGFTEIGRDYIDSFQNWIQRLFEREPKWEELSNNRQRIRFLYRNFLLRCMRAGYTYKKHLTPRETSKDILAWQQDRGSQIEDLAQIYDSIRYGQDDVEDRKVQNLAKDFLDK